jgi:hypothetical protein
VLNTILYISDGGIRNDVNKRQRTTSAAPTASAIVASTTRRPYTRYNNDTGATTTHHDVLFDRKVDLITEGIDPFYVSMLRELSQDNALTIVNYILSMKNEIDLSDNYRKLDIYSLYRISKFFNNEKSYKNLVREDLLQFLDSLRKPEASDST